jgi:hypothetical protein
MVETAIAMILLWLIIIVACIIVIVEDWYCEDKEYKPSKRLARRWKEQIAAGMTAAMLTPFYIMIDGPRCAPHNLREFKDEQT